MFNWDDLRFFLELGRQRRLSSTARTFSVNHVTVGRRVSRLEADLAVKLFHRDESGFVLTAAGQKLFEAAEQMETWAQRLEHTVAKPALGLSGRVRLTTMEGIAAFYLSSRLADFRHQFPNIVVELATERHLIDLRRREADICVSFIAIEGPRLTCRKAGEFRLGLFASHSYLARKGKPLDRGDLHSHDFVDYVEDLVAISPVHWLLDVLTPTNVTFRSSSMAAQQQAARAGFGIALLPYFSAKTAPDLIAILPDDVSVARNIFVTVHEDMEYVSRIRALTRFVSDLFCSDRKYLTDLHSPPVNNSYF
jgi:DNA-binding transcriptional LysR family regulator